MPVRRASHANSWYSGNASQLDRELSSWLSVVAPLPTPARAVICPHAGYSYSGPTAAYRSLTALVIVSEKFHMLFDFSFRQIDPNTVKTIFILGPSHHVRLSGCAVSQCDSYKTPIGDLTINKDLTKELLDTGDDRDSLVLLRG